jgi:hypothetical protein
MPPPGAAPRVAAELSSLVSRVRHGLTILRNTGRAHQADALRQALLGSLASNALRAAAERELDAPGAIFRMITDHHMRHMPPMQHAAA